MRRTLPLLAVWLLAAAVAPAAEKASDEQLRFINQRIQELNGKLEAIKSEKSTILTEIYRIELQSETVIVELNRLGTQVQRKQEQVQRKRAEEKLLEAHVARSRENLRRIVRILYKMGDLGYVRLFFQIGSFDQLFRNYRLLVALVAYKAEEIAVVKADMAQLATVRGEIEAELQRLLGLKNEQGDKLRRMMQLKQEKLAFIRRINQERDSHLRLVEELRQEAENLNQLVEQKAQTAIDSIGDIPRLKGKLDWPLKGVVTARFGRQKSARFDTYTINNGIEIRPLQSDDVRAVLPGEIVFADYFRGYGNLLIVQHARNFHTLYGHCDRFLRNKGDKVLAGEAIAVAGSSGSLSGKSLYFEVRTELKPEDPLKWLGKR
jgi:septal ring factor EnvC (AmiA/AmiB activator)